MVRSALVRHCDDHVRPLLPSHLQSTITIRCRAFADSYLIDCGTSNTASLLIDKCFSSPLVHEGRTLRVRRDKTPSQRIVARGLGKVWTRAHRLLTESQKRCENDKLVTDSNRGVLFHVRNESAMRVCESKNGDDEITFHVAKDFMEKYNVDQATARLWEEEAKEATRPRL